jgi:hypothetical protein
MTKRPHVTIYRNMVYRFRLDWLRLPIITHIAKQNTTVYNLDDMVSDGLSINQI